MSSLDSNLPTIEDLAIRFDPPAHVLIKPGRRVLAQGFLQRQGRWSLVDRWCFLLTDMFIIAEPNKSLSEFKLKQQVDLRGTTLDLRRSNTKGVPLETALPHVLQIITAAETLICGSSDRSQVWDWAFNIQQAIAALMSADHDPMCQSFGWYHYLLLGTVHAAALTSDIPLLESLVSLPPATSPTGLASRTPIQSVDATDHMGYTALMLAAHSNLINVAAKLIELGADVSFSTPNGESAIHIALSEGHVEMIEFLLNAKPAELTAKDSRGRTLLESCALDGIDAEVEPESGAPQSAAARRRVAVVKSLCALRVDVNQRTSGGCSLLHELALSPSRADIAEELIRAGANVDAVNDEDLTPLLVASLAGTTAMVNLLLKYGADANVCDPLGRTPLLIAAQDDNRELATALLKNGAQPNLTLPATRLEDEAPGTQHPASPKSLRKAKFVSRPVDAVVSVDMLTRLVGFGLHWPPVEMGAAATSASSAASTDSSALDRITSTFSTLLSALDSPPPPPRSGKAAAAADDHQPGATAPASPELISLYVSDPSAQWKALASAPAVKRKLKDAYDAYTELAEVGVHIPSSQWRPAAVMVPDVQAPRCQLCTAEFSLLLNRHHHCRRCGRNVCGACASCLVHVDPDSGKSNDSNQQRVCTGCFNMFSHRKVSVKNAAATSAPSISSSKDAATAANSSKPPPPVSSPPALPAASASSNNDKEKLAKAAAPAKGSSAAPNAESRRASTTSSSSSASTDPKQSIKGVQQQADDANKVFGSMVGAAQDNLNLAREIGTKTDAMRQAAMEFRENARKLKEQEKNRVGSSWW